MNRIAAVCYEKSDRLWQIIKQSGLQEENLIHLSVMPITQEGFPTVFASGEEKYPFPV